MSSTVPKAVQRFRARELQRLWDKGERARWFRDIQIPVRQTDVNARDIPSHITLHNPFLPRLLSDPNARATADLSASGEAESIGQKLEKDEKGTNERNERRKWVQPHYSLRRQAVLVKQARASGTLHLLPPGPKLSIEELEAAKLEARRREAEEEAKVQAEAEEERATQETEEQTESSVRPSRRVVKRSIAALGHPRVAFRWTGKAPEKPRKRLTIYTGRRRMFKGHKWERNLDKRRAQIAVRMRDMPKRIRRFKNVYKRRRPDPLKPAAPRKRESLPF